MDEERGIWEYQCSPRTWDDDDGEIEVVRLPSGAVRISVTEEKAVDSYNAEFTCNVTLPPDIVANLLAFLATNPLPGTEGR